MSMKDLGDVEHIIGKQIKRAKYIEKVLDKFNVADAKLLGVPL